MSTENDRSGDVRIPSCARCGDPQRDHLDHTGQPRQGWQRSRFTGSGFCGAQHKSGGIVGSLQWCGCLGFQEAS